MFIAQTAACSYGWCFRTQEAPWLEYRQICTSGEKRKQPTTWKFKWWKNRAQEQTPERSTPKCSRKMSKVPFIVWPLLRSLLVRCVFRGSASWCTGEMGQTFPTAGTDGSKIGVGDENLKVFQVGFRRD